MNVFGTDDETDEPLVWFNGKVGGEGNDSWNNFKAIVKNTNKTFLDNADATEGGWEVNEDWSQEFSSTFDAGTGGQVDIEGMSEEEITDLVNNLA